MLNKENEMYSVNKWQTGSYHVRLGSEEGPFGQGKHISPIKRNKIGDSIITNIFDDYARSTTDLGYPVHNDEGYGFRTCK